MDISVDVRLQDITAKISKVSLVQTVRVLRAAAFVLEHTGYEEESEILNELMKLNELDNVYDKPNEDEQGYTDTLYRQLRVIDKTMIFELGKTNRDY